MFLSLYSNLCFVIHLHKFVRQVTRCFHISFLPSSYLVCIIFSMPSFFMMFLRIFSCFFLILHISDIFVFIFHKSFPLLTHGDHGIIYRMISLASRSHFISESIISIHSHIEGIILHNSSEMFFFLVFNEIFLLLILCLDFGCHFF